MAHKYEVMVRTYSHKLWVSYDTLPAWFGEEHKLLEQRLYKTRPDYVIEQRTWLYL